MPDDISRLHWTEGSRWRLDKFKTTPGTLFSQLILLCNGVFTVGSSISQDNSLDLDNLPLCQATGPACNGQPLSRGVTPAEIQTILEVHNRYRARIARGEETRGSPGPQPPAANMKIMVSLIGCDHII